MASPPRGRLDRVRADLVDRAVQHARHAAADDPRRADLLGTLLRQYWQQVPPEDLVGRDPIDAHGAALSQLEFAWRRTSGTALVRVISPTEAGHGWACPHS